MAAQRFTQQALAMSLAVCPRSVKEVAPERDRTIERRTEVKRLGFADAQAALLRAAKDDDEKVRLAAMDLLASRPALRTQLRDLAANDPSERVREVAQCRLMVAENVP